MCEVHDGFLEEGGRARRAVTGKAAVAIGALPQQLWQQYPGNALVGADRAGGIVPNVLHAGGHCRAAPDGRE